MIDTKTSDRVEGHGRSFYAELIQVPTDFVSITTWRLSSARTCCVRHPALMIR